MRHMRLGVRARWLVLAVAAFVLVSAVVGSAVGGTTASDLAALRADLSSSALTRPVQVHQVTLVTGDRVTVRVLPGGRYSTSTRIAPRANGRTVLVQTVTDRHGVFVLPSDAAALISSGKVDPDLFNVKYLIANGYADDASHVVPMIVEYRHAAAAGALERRARALPVRARVRALASVHGVAVRLAKRSARRFWANLHGVGRRFISRVWLDHKVHVNLDQSVPMIGAPQVWASGYDGSGVDVAVLDTGIDATHPDLAGKVVASKDFSGTGDTADHFGHGTHVASTIVGSGAASGGRYRGVAPGAELLNGKVLDDNGSGFDSQIIEGMQWATASGARVVSMSLGGDPTDGTDPLSQAVNDLTAQYGTLFVIAAGNSGPGGQTIETPGAADSALTVAAVDKSDQLADFSSRGPRFGDWALKPDIAAPGVHITAARAAGTALGTVVDQYYTTLSGTSMATPHVAGSAALLLDEHPTWQADKLKEVLTETAKDDGYSVYEQGSGRVDVFAASRATVYASPSHLDFGRIRFDADPSPIARQVTYHNDGTAPVTLDLSTAFSRSDGGEAPSGMLTLSPATLTVPAGGTADATATLDPSMGDLGGYSGVITAVPSSGPTLRIAVGAYKEPPGFDLSLKVEAPDGSNAVGIANWIITRTDQPADPIFLAPSSATTVHLTEGVYNVSTLMAWGKGLFWDHWAVPVDPQVNLDHDQTVTLDANKAVPLQVHTPEANEPISSGVSFTATAAGGSAADAVSIEVEELYGMEPEALPTNQVTVGSFNFDHVHVLAHPLVTAEIKGGPPLALHPHYASYADRIPKLVGSEDIPVVDVGSGAPQDLQGQDLKGKIALVDIGDRGLTDWIGDPPDALDVVANAAAAGAKAVLAYPDYEGTPFNQLFVADGAWYPIPTLALTPEEGQALRARLQQPGSHQLHLNAIAASPYTWTLGYPEPAGRVPAELEHSVARGDVATIRDGYHLEHPGHFAQIWAMFRPNALAGTGATAGNFSGPASRTEYVGPLSSSIRWVRAGSGGDSHGVGYYGMTDDVFASPTKSSETWWQSPSPPGFVTLSPESRALGASWQCAVCRYSGLLPEDLLLPWPTVTDIDDHFTEITTHSQDFFGDTGCTILCDEWHLYRGDEEILPHYLIPVGPGALPYFVMPSGPATYRLTERFKYELEPNFGRHVETSWQFASDDATGHDIPDGYDQVGLCRAGCRVEPLLFLAYRLNLDPDNTISALGSHVFTVVARHQPSALPLPAVAGLSAAVSIDDGAHWQQVPSDPLGGGRYRVTVDAAKLAHAATVAVRIKAWDTAGNRVNQTVYDAWGIRSK